MDRRVFCLTLLAAWACVGQKEKDEKEDLADDAYYNYNPTSGSPGGQLVPPGEKDLPAGGTYWLRSTIARLEDQMLRQERRLEQALNTIRVINNTYQTALNG